MWALLIFLTIITFVFLMIFHGTHSEPKVTIVTVLLLAPKQSKIAGVRIGQKVQVYGELVLILEPILLSLCEVIVLYSVIIITQNCVIRHSFIQDILLDMYEQKLHVIKNSLQPF